MPELKFDLSKRLGKFKPLNATNGGPWHCRYKKDQWRSNFSDYKAARIPYSRCHDSNFASVYGGPYSYDITAVFPDFGADPLDPASYDFACTDEAVLTALDAGTETFFRLGECIEHQIKKHATIPPADFGKWAVICEHVIRHFNEGWADGLRLNIRYWEIWNEPEGALTWGGTREQFFDLYETAAKHLKACFPGLKIGGPALYDLGYCEEFLKEMSRRGVEMDFLSWHIYCVDPRQLADSARSFRALMDRYGYGKSESILNEWNYVRGWEEDFLYSIETVGGIKGAAFMMACMSEAQKAPVDMLMYYDTRPSAFNGVFDFYTYRKKKGYYPLFWYGKFYDAEAEIRCVSEPENIYTLCGVNSEGKILAVVTYYSDDDSAPKIPLDIDFGRPGAKYRIYRLDGGHDGEEVAPAEKLSFELGVFTSLLIEEI